VGTLCACDLLFLVKASAPGKIILFGEHAVVYTRPALAVPVTQVRVDVEVRDSPRAGIWIDAADINLRAELTSLPGDHPIASVILKLFNLLDISKPPGLQVDISSTIPVASGLGSGAAVSVALARALSGYFDRVLTHEQVNDLAFEVEKLHHGTPSGIDNTVITYAKPVYFIKGQPIETFTVGGPFTIVIGDTGIPAPTKESVGDVRNLWLKDREKFEKIFDEIGQISLIARHSIENGEPKRLGELMDQNHELLQRLTVSAPELDHLVQTARNAGASGAKMSGGGRGGNMIALVEKEKAETVANALISAGAKGTIVTEIK
jgi:mevalonate kinase